LTLVSPMKTVTLINHLLTIALGHVG